MANTVGINDETMGLLKHVASKAGLSQAEEAVKQGLILYAEQLGLVTPRVQSRNAYQHVYQFR